MFVSFVFCRFGQSIDHIEIAFPALNKKTKANRYHVLRPSKKKKKGTFIIHNLCNFNLISGFEEHNHPTLYLHQ